MELRQFVFTSAAGKRLIGKAMAQHPAVQAATHSGTLVIVAGTTNSYVAEEVLAGLGESGFERAGFRRGITTPPNPPAGKPSGEFSGDVVISGGKWQRGKTIFDVVDDLKEGDVILKGVNAFDRHGLAGVLIGDRKGGTVAAGLQAVVGRRVELILPAGLEKRVLEDIGEIAFTLNQPGGTGPRMMPVCGELFTELDAMALLTGVHARLVAGGGTHGAEGAVWVAVEGDADHVNAAAALYEEVKDEPAYDG